MYGLDQILDLHKQPMPYIMIITSNKQFSRWRHLTTTTTIQFVFLFIFTFCIPSGVKITIALIKDGAY